MTEHSFQGHFPGQGLVRQWVLAGWEGCGLWSASQRLMQPLVKDPAHGTREPPKPWGCSPGGLEDWPTPISGASMSWRCSLSRVKQPAVSRLLLPCLWCPSPLWPAQTAHPGRTFWALPLLLLWGGGEQRTIQSWWSHRWLLPDCEIL